MFAGTVITGPVVSRTVTVKAPVVVWLAASVALMVTVVTPRGKTVPLSCEWVRLVTPTIFVASTAS